jgi:hypothetical protein
VYAKKDAKGNVKFYHRDGIKGPLKGVAEGSLNEFAPGAGGDDGDDEAGDDPYKYPKPKRYNHSADYFEQFEADHFDREDFDDDTGVFKGYWGNTQIAYFKFDNPARTGGNNPGMGWYYEPQTNNRGDDTNAAPAADDSAERKQQELSMIRAFLKSGQTPKPGSQIYSLMKKHGLAEGLSKQFEIIYLDQSGERKRKIVSGTSKEAVARQFKKQYKLEIEQVKQLQQGVAEGFQYDVDHMPGPRKSLADVNKTSKYVVATNAIGGTKEHRVTVNATSKNNAMNLALDQFEKKGLKPRIDFDGLRLISGVAEGTKETSTGRIHKSEPGGYGRRDDDDIKKKEKAAEPVKRGRGRPKKDADSETGEVKKWDTDTLQRWIVGSVPKKLPGKASVKHKIKDEPDDKMDESMRRKQTKEMASAGASSSGGFAVAPAAKKKIIKR